MRIGIITPGFSASVDDWCIPVLLNLVRELSQRHEVHVFTIRYPHRRGTYQIYDASVYAFGGGLVTGVRRASLLGRVLTGIIRQHRSFPFDVLHAFWADEPGFVATVLHRLLNIPSVVSLMGGELVAMPEIGYGGQLGMVNRRLVHLALQHATCATAGSHYLYDMAIAHGRSQRLDVLPLGVDRAMFHPGDRPDDSVSLAGEVKLLHVASLVPVKDQATLLHALRWVLNAIPGAHLHVVGDGELRRDLERLVQKLGLAGHVTFHGNVSHERLPGYYRAADLCVLASRHECQELVTLEAAACGRATVGTSVGLLPDLGQAGRTVPVGDAEALARVLIETLRDAEGLAAMGRSCERVVADRYDLERSVAALDALYGELLAR